MLQGFKEPIRCIEVGTWFGLGSTQVFLNHLPHGSELILIDRWDFELGTPSPRLLGGEQDLHTSFAEFAMSAYNSTIEQVEEFNRRHPGRIAVEVRRGMSVTELKKMPPTAFDVIYLDSNHDFETVRQELPLALNALALDRKSFICGDDLEWPITDLNVKLATKCRNREQAKPEGFHPGVLLALAESLPQVQMQHGFWWLQVGERS
jgi:hypothetical protein